MFSPAKAVVIAATVLIGVASPAYSQYGVTTQNVRVGLPAPEARHDVRDAAAFGSVVFTQENGHRRARRFAPAGWGTAHAAGTYRGDCATYWRRDVWRLRRAYVVRILDVATPGEPSNGHRWALVAVLSHRQTWAGVCVHMPTPKAGRGAYRTAAANVRRLLARLSSRYAGRVFVGGDWNRRFSRRPAFGGYAARRPPGATHANGVRIDYVYVRRPAYAARIRVIGGTYSDHNGVRIWVRAG